MAPIQCRSARRCNQITCATCAWRHSGQVTRKVLEGWDGPFYATTLTIRDPTPDGFRFFRMEMRNRIAYLRKSPVWRNFGLLLYRTGDGTLRGTAALSGLGAADMWEGLGGRWAMTVRLILPENLRFEVSRCMRPAVMPPTLTGRGGYQALRLTIGPSRSVVRTPVLSSYPPEFVAPMPVLL